LGGGQTGERGGRRRFERLRLRQGGKGRKFEADGRGQGGVELPRGGGGRQAGRSMRLKFQEE
jgi:hypothetical protein